MAAEKADFLRFTHVVERGGHNTYRLLMDKAPENEIEKAQRELQARGLTVERNEAGILLAVDVPPCEAQDEVDRYLTENKESGRWQLQDGHLNNPIVSERGYFITLGANPRARHGANSRWMNFPQNGI